MKSLIRFEDTYGITDIFMKCHNLPYLDPKLIGNKLIQIDDETYIDFGCSSNCFYLSNDEAYAIVELGIERIIIVYDLDNESGNKNDLTSKSSIQKGINDLNNSLANLGYTVDLRFVQLVYAAETIMLHQELDESEGIHIENLVHVNNTNELHLAILSNLLDYSNYGKTKQVRQYLDINKLKTMLSNHKIDNLNYRFYDWILNNMPTDYDELMTRKEVLDHLDFVTKHFKYWQQRAVEDKRQLMIKDVDKEKILSFYKNNKREKISKYNQIISQRASNQTNGIAPDHQIN